MVQHLVKSIPKETNHVHRFAYDVIMIMEPATLLGTVYGVIASRMVPYWLISLFAVFFLLYSARLTYLKAYEVREKELSTEGEKLISNDESSIEKSYGTLYPDMIVEETYDIPVLKDRILVRSLLTMLFCSITVVFSSYLINEDSAVTCGSTAYFASIMLVSICVIVLILLNLSFLYKFQKREGQNILGKALTVDWIDGNRLWLVMLCFLAGFLSSFCGVGGSTIKNPIILYMGLNPTLAKSSSQFMLFSTVLSSTLQFWFYNAIPYNYAILYFCISLIAGFTGKYVIDLYVHKRGTQSIIVFLLATYIFLSAIAIGSIGALIVIGQIMYFDKSSLKQLQFRSPCVQLPSDLAALKLLTGY